ncbi:hypothetical protein DPMN_062717 [Dreissena polymorpha]|uniref:Uncharacterized protein n=1 Tax=Dreissena polymorpha TaxID=45954 RepID=A0A9D4CAA1_DREPO|nr:hypothetical protein DPMN_062717 [Dreissena polymorpha]
MLGYLTQHYERTQSYVKTSPLNDTIQARLDAIYVSPKVQLISKVEGSFQITVRQITTYTEFINVKQSKRLTFIQGEAGTGKTTFLSRLVMDWCYTSSSTTKQDPSSTEETIGRNYSTRAKNTIYFDDVATLKEYKFVFHIVLRHAVKQFEIEKKI